MACQNTRTSDPLKGLANGSRLGFSALDKLLQVSASAFDHQVESLARELDKKNISLIEDEEAPTSFRDATNQKNHLSLTGQLLSLPRLDREDEIRLARRYALVKKRFFDALQRQGLLNKEDTVTNLFCRETPSRGRCDCSSCEEWEGRVDGTSRMEIKQRCREFNLVRNTFLEGSLYMVALSLTRFSNNNVHGDDLLQEGSASLFRALDRFDWRHGVRFRTYAEYWINQAFTEAVHNQSRTVRVPIWVQKATRKINRAKLAAGGAGTKAQMVKVAEKLEMPLEKVEQVLAGNRQTVSLDWEDSSGQSGSFADTIEAKESAIDDSINREKETLLPRRMQEILSTIPPRERFVLEHRYGLSGKDIKTLIELGEDLGVSAERIRQIQAVALRRLQEPAARKLLAAV